MLTKFITTNFWSITEKFVSQKKPRALMAVSFYELFEPRRHFMSTVFLSLHLKEEKEKFMSFLIENNRKSGMNTKYQ